MNLQLPVPEKWGGRTTPAQVRGQQENVTLVIPHPILITEKGKELTHWIQAPAAFPQPIPTHMKAQKANTLFSQSHFN